MKNKFLSRIGQWHTPPHLRKCLTSLKALTLLLVMLMSVNVWGEVTSPWSYTFLSTDQLDTSGDAITRNGVTWNIATTVGKGSPSITFVSQKYSNVSNTAMKFGSSKSIYYSAITFSTGAFASKKVSKVEITYALNGGASTTITATQGSTTIGSDTYSTGQTWNTSTLNTNEGTGGSLSISITTTQAILINTISVTFTEGTSPTDPSLSVSPATIDFGTVYQNAEVDAKDVTVTFANLTTNDVAAAISGSAFSIDKTGSFTSGDKITITPSTATLDEYEETLTLSATGVDDQTVTIKMNVVEAPAPTGTFVKFTGDELKEGDYVLVYGEKAVSNVLLSNKLQSGTYTLTDNAIQNPDESIIWHIAVNETHWTIYSEAAGKYAGGSTSKNNAALLTEVTNYALWDVTIDNQKNTYDFANVGRAGGTSDTGNKWLHCNTGSNNVWAPYTSSTGGALTLYKKYVEPVKNKVTLDAEIEHGTISATPASGTLESVEEDVVVTLTNTPADGYKLDAYDVYKTGESETKVTVKEESGVYTFKMPAYAVTVSATFSLSIETPTLSEAAGDKNDAIYVKVTNYNGDYSYYYTLDGTEPTNASTLYVDADGIAINASCTLKVIAYSGDVTSPVVSAAYNLPLMTMDAIFAKATAAGKTATDARVKFTDCVISGVKNNNAYLTDNAGKGLIIYASSHGFEVNDKLNGAVNVKVQLYNGSAELTELTSSTSGLTVTKDGSVSPITTIGIASLSGVNTGAVLSYENLTYDGEYFSDGTNGIKPYNNFNIEDYPTFENGDKYNVTGVYIQFNSTKEIAPRSLTDLEKIEAQKYAINLATVEHGTIATDPETEAADGVKVTLSATPDAGYMLSAWSVVDAESNPVEVINNQFTMPAMAVTVSATFVELPIWATTYTSNVTVGTDKVRFSEDGEQYDAKKVGSSGSAGSTTITVPAGTYAIHFHAAGWNSENVTLAVKKGETVLGSFDIPKDAGMSNNTPFTLENDPATEEYFMVNLSDITKETTITFVATSGKRFAIYGVNALAPAAITIDPASKDFGEAKIDGSNNPQQVFTLTPNAFATGTITAEIDGDNVFTASTIADNKVTVTFAPTEITEYNATLIIKHDGTQMCTAALSGNGIAATTPEIAVSDDEIDFGKVKQDATVADQAVTVTLSYLDAATASIDDDTYFSIDKTDLVAGENTITISATASSTGVKNATITIEGTGATTKTIAVKMDVASKWAGEYTSNVEVGSDKVIISEEEYEAIKKGTSSKSESATITVPKGTQTLHFHAAAWNNENTVLVVKQGDTELGSFNLYKDAGVKSNSPFTLAGNNYDTDQYFYVNVSAYTATDAAVITFTTTASPYRFVLYGVNQEGGIVPILDHLTITGSATHTEYEVDETFDPAGLTVNAIYTLAGVAQDPVDVTEDVEWEFTPATLTAGSYDVTVKATYEDKEVSTTVAVEVTAATPEITVDATEVGFGTVAQDATIDAKTVAVTLKAITEATVEVSGEGKDAFNVTPASLTESGNITITPVTTAAGEFTATITISADGAEPQEVALSMIVEAPDVCDGTDDFETSENTSASSYTERSTTAGWSAVNAARTKIVEDIFFTINGKTSAVGVITSPELEDGIASLKIRYANTFQEANGVSFRVDIKQGGEVVETYTVTKANADVAQNTVYTETISDINVAGTYQIIITNLSPTSSSSNKDRLSIGRLCWTHYAGAPEYDETVRENVTAGTIGTMVYEHNITAIAGAVIYEPNYVEGNELEFIEVLPENTVAGLPYIFVANGENDGKVQINFGTDDPAIDCDHTNRGLVGNMGLEAIYVSDPSYAIYQNQIRPANNTKVAVGRAYIENITVLYELEPIVTSAPRRRFSLGIERNMPTGFETIMMQKGMNKVIMNNQLYLIRDGKLFNAQGALVK